VDLVGLMRQQEGVLARRHVLESGLDDLHIARMLRRREWARVFRGVYVDHTGALTWLQRAWAATLLHEPAALAGRSALRAHGIAMGSPDDDIELVIPCHRRVDDPPGVRTSRAPDRRATTTRDTGTHGAVPRRGVRRPRDRRRAGVDVVTRPHEIGGSISTEIFRAC
jgi:hypothetical protein